MYLLIVSNPELNHRALTCLDPQKWKVVFPSLYSSIWMGSNKEIDLSVIQMYVPRFQRIYVEEGLRLESITLLQHAIEKLGIKEYYLCDFDSTEDINHAIDTAYFVDQQHANAKYAEFKINSLFSTKLSSAIKSHAITVRTQNYKKTTRRVDFTELGRLTNIWHKQMQNYFILLPTLAGLSWIIKAERKIDAFDPTSIHRVYVQYAKDGIDFSVTYKTAYTEQFSQERDDTIEYLRNPANRHIVSFYQTEEKEIKPPQKPIILSSLQSQMFYLYHFSIEYTTKIAKRLFQAGLISNPLTSSYFIPHETAIDIIRMLNAKYGDSYVLQTQRDFKCEDTSTTAIFPTHFDPEYFPANIENVEEFDTIKFESVKMKHDAAIVYSYIYAINEWLQMKNAIHDASVLEIKVGNKSLEAKANYMVDVYDPETYTYKPQTCWKNVHQDLQKAINSISGNTENEDPLLVLPKCSFGEELIPLGVSYSIITPKRPPRYGVGRFNTQILGGKGIGTEESFHIIQNNLVGAGIVALINNMMHPADIAKETIEWCEEFCPDFLEEEYIHEYWNRLRGVRFDGEDPIQLINEFDYLINEILERAGFNSNNGSLTQKQVTLAKSIAIKKRIRIDDPDLFFSNAEKVKQFLAIYASETNNKEEEKLFKCPICRQGYVFMREYVNVESQEVSPYYACENHSCFQIYDSTIDKFFVEKKKDFTPEERLEALRNIASKQHLKNKGYLFTGFIGKNEKPYEAKVIIDTYPDAKNNIRYFLKLLF